MPVLFSIRGWESADVEGHLYVEDLSIRGFWYLLESWKQSPVDTEGQQKFLGSQKYMRFSKLPRGQGS